MSDWKVKSTEIYTIIVKKYVKDKENLSQLEEFYYLYIPKGCLTIP